MPSISTPVPALASLARRYWFPLHQRKPRELPRRLSLGADGAPALSLRAQGVLRVTCTAGTVWLTCERDIRDHVLEAGDEHLARPGDALVLVGMPSATVLVTDC
jgi:hypothetical protein